MKDTTYVLFTFVISYLPIIFSVFRKEGNVLFNDTLNTFYLRLWHQTYGKGPIR